MWVWILNECWLIRTFVALWLWINHLFNNYIAAWQKFVVATSVLCPTQDEKPLYHCVTIAWPLAWEYTGKTVCWIDEKARLVVLSLPLCEYFGVRWGGVPHDLQHFNHMPFFLLIVPAFSPTSSQLKQSIFVQSVTLLLASAPSSPPLCSVLRSVFCGVPHLVRPQQH